MQRKLHRQESHRQEEVTVPTRSHRQAKRPGLPTVERPGLFASAVKLCGEKLLLLCRDFGEDCFAVGVGVNLLPVLYDLAGGRDQNGIALGELVVATCGHGNAVGIDDSYGQDQQRSLKVKRVLAAEGLVALDGVRARDAENDCVEGFILGKIFLEICELRWYNRWSCPWGRSERTTHLPL